MILVVTAVGGLIVGIMAKYGSAKIKGHGIPEAMEAVLVNRSRISPRVAVLKPLSAAIAIRNRRPVRGGRADHSDGWGGRLDGRTGAPHDGS